MFLLVGLLISLGNDVCLGSTFLESPHKIMFPWQSNYLSEILEQNVPLVFQMSRFWNKMEYYMYFLRNCTQKVGIISF